MSGLVDSGVVDILTGAISTGSNVGGFVNNIAITPSTFWLWLWGIIKNILFWLLNHRYWFVGAVVVYISIILLYNYIWGKVVVYFQKKGYDEFRKKNSGEIS